MSEEHRKDYLKEQLFKMGYCKTQNGLELYKMSLDELEKKYSLFKNILDGISKEIRNMEAYT